MLLSPIDRAGTLITRSYETASVSDRRIRR